MAAAGGGAAAGRAYSFKVVLLGEGCVGKTSLVLRYCENKFNDKHITTLQVQTPGSSAGDPRPLLCLWPVITPFPAFPLPFAIALGTRGSPAACRCQDPQWGGRGPGKVPSCRWRLRRSGSPPGLRAGFPL